MEIVNLLILNENEQKLHQNKSNRLKCSTQHTDVFCIVYIVLRTNNFRQKKISIAERTDNTSKIPFNHF